MMSIRSVNFFAYLRMNLDLVSLRKSKVETPANIGKMLVIDVDSEDYEIAGTGIMISQNHTQLFRFQARCGTIKYVLELLKPTRVRIDLDSDPQCRVGQDISRRTFSN